MSPKQARAGRRLNHRAIVVIGATVTGLALPVTGFVDHLLLDSPSGAGFNAESVAHWTCALLFVGFVAVHVVLNWRAYRRHIAEVSGGLLFSPKRASQSPPRSSSCSGPSSATPQAAIGDAVAEPS
jgi:hypothetical protein